MNCNGSHHFSHLNENYAVYQLKNIPIRRIEMVAKKKKNKEKRRQKMRLFEENWQRKQTRDIEKMKCMLYRWQKETMWSVHTGSMYPVMMTYMDAYIKKHPETMHIGGKKARCFRLSCRYFSLARGKIFEKDTVNLFSVASLTHLTHRHIWETKVQSLL